MCLSQNGVKNPEFMDWKGDLQRIVRAETVVDNLGALRPGELESILQTILQLVCYVRPLISLEVSDDVDDEFSLNLLGVAAKLRHGFLDRLEEREGLTFAERQLTARLHTYFGLTKKDTTRQSIIQSRAFVYFLGNYRPESEYGPFLTTGAVNWEHMQAIHHVVSVHIVELGEDEEFEFAFFPMSLPFTQIVIPKGIVFDETEDWAGVAGDWSVSFCFCDHRELLRFNEASSKGLDTSVFEDPEFREVFRTIETKLWFVKAEPDPDHPTRPVIYFYGEMQSPSSTMAGHIKMTVDDQVSWHFTSGDQGNALWSSEGIQIGGLQSGYGVLGSWSTIFHDSDDPVGPFWMQKHRHDDVPAA
ncbi:hypothetical protein NLJ89_g3219 [Agrocybe chaxingu]|uniref:Uncharacterized protein n=1 Tax=Agrocybe chaxingu TaxID=84603 RepID=A0A9W8K550_9AGAR|nr:hypothetical protein NLJ89_g3219 [Agrocybe chaxingu]